MASTDFSTPKLVIVHPINGLTRNTPVTLYRLVNLCMVVWKYNKQQQQQHIYIINIMRRDRMRTREHPAKDLYIKVNCCWKWLIRTCTKEWYMCGVCVDARITLWEARKVNVKERELVLLSLSSFWSAKWLSCRAMLPIYILSHSMCTHVNTTLMPYSNVFTIPKKDLFMILTSESSETTDVSTFWDDLSRGCVSCV